MVNRFTYISVCSGIEAATVAWHQLGWSPFALSEIEKFPSAVLAHHYPTVPNLGDMTRFQEWPDAAIDVLVGGTPCQSFSVAGLRKGLADPRGNLMLTYLAIAERYRPSWLVWENVPGVLSSGGGLDFACLLRGLAELGYGFAYRVLDAQHFGVPQRRRRVFVVGHLGDWRRAAAVLFERASLRGDPAPSREARKGVAGTVGTSSSSGRSYGSSPIDSNLIEAPPVATCLNAGAMGRQDAESETLIPTGGCFDVAHSLRADGFDASEDGTGRGTPRAPVATGFNARQDPDAWHERTGPLDTDGCTQAVAFQSSQSGVRTGDAHATLDSNNGSRRHNGIATGSAVRRLTPEECEKLQGFPPGYTLIPFRGKPAADGPRYKALGNSMAVPVMRWIGERIAMVDASVAQQEAA